jgi:predicted XRE-type DNA-binding protein
VLSPKPVKLHRNPVYLAEEWRKRIQIQGFTQAEPAREMGVTRARVTQLMNIVKLPKVKLDDLKSLGDPMEKRFVTERMLRREC